jgi:arginine:pyruvate transaminase
VVVAATPSYPLFASLAEAAEVRLEPHALQYEGRWRLDPAALAAALSPRVRALLTVGPGNPTGACLGRWTAAASCRPPCSATSR